MERQVISFFFMTSSSITQVSVMQQFEHENSRSSRKLNAVNYQNNVWISIRISSLPKAMYIIHTLLSGERNGDTISVQFKTMNSPQTFIKLFSSLSWHMCI